MVLLLLHVHCIIQTQFSIRPLHTCSERAASIDAFCSFLLTRAGLNISWARWEMERERERGVEVPWGLGRLLKRGREWRSLAGSGGQIDPAEKACQAARSRRWRALCPIGRLASYYLIFDHSIVLSSRYIIPSKTMHVVLASLNSHQFE